jgi:cytidine kinase
MANPIYYLLSYFPLMGEMATQNYDIAVVGHLSVDSIILPSRDKPFVVLGGSAAYTSFAAKRLDAKTMVISKVGGDFPEAYLWWLKQEDINVSAVLRAPQEPTTSFELAYNGDLSERTLRLKSKGTAIDVSEVPTNFHAKAIHIAPIANEVSYELVERLKQCGDTLSLDPQGLIRSFNAEGAVSEDASVDSRIFSLINIYKSSQKEILALTGKSELKPAVKAIHDYGVETVIVTNGAKGSLLSVGGAQYDVAACPPEVLVDPTGAGDAFIGGFLTEYVRQKESVWCACVGAAISCMVVEGIGPTFFGKKEEIYKIATHMHENGFNQEAAKTARSL